MKKILLTILIIVVVAGVSGGGVYLWQKKFTQKGDIQTITNSTNKTEQGNCSAVDQNNSICLPDESIISDGGSNLKKFKNERYGIQFDFPSNYKVSVSHSFEDTDKIVLSSPNSNQYNQGNIIFSIKYNPTFADPLDQAKKAYQDCLVDLEKNGGVGYGCFDSTGAWKKITIDDKSYGYKTGIGGDPVLLVSFYAISSMFGPKGSTFQFDAYLPQFDTSKGTDTPIDQLAAQDPGVQKLLADLDQIIKSIKFTGQNI